MFYFKLEEASKFTNVIRIRGEKYIGDKLFIPVEQFAGTVFSVHASTAYYVKWFSELVDFAELLQDESLQFYASN